MKTNSMFRDINGIWDRIIEVESAIADLQTQLGLHKHEMLNAIMHHISMGDLSTDCLRVSFTTLLKETRKQ